jgi:hypothetical protein
LSLQFWRYVIFGLRVFVVNIICSQSAESLHILSAHLEIVKSLLHHDVLSSEICLIDADWRWWQIFLDNITK